MLGDIVPISSRKSVPPRGLFEQASLVVRRAGERPSHMPEQLRFEQLTGIKGPRACGEKRWMARATSSLPVPVPPVIRTVSRVGATRSIRSNILCIIGLFPMIPSQDQ